MGRVQYFTADLHLRHPKLAQLRGFGSVPEHDAAVIGELATLDPDTDVLWVLGDICSGGVASMESALDQLSEVPVRKHLVTGNHDPCHPMRRNAQRFFPAFAEVFASIQQSARVKIGTTGVLLSHFPYAGTADRLDRDEFAQYQLPNLGMWLLHGHTHSPEQRSGDRLICVSLEAWGLRAASETDLAVLING